MTSNGLSEETLGTDAENQSNNKNDPKSDRRNFHENNQRSLTWPRTRTRPKKTRTCFTESLFEGESRKVQPRTRGEDDADENPGA